MIDTKRTLGEFVLQMRETKGLSRDKLAAIAGINSKTIYRIEKGEEPNPKRASLVALAKVFGLPVSDLERLVVPDGSDVGRAIYSARVAAGYATPQAFAAAIGHECTAEMVESWEGGELQPTEADVSRVAALTGIEVPRILGQDATLNKGAGAALKNELVERVLDTDDARKLTAEQRYYLAGLLSASSAGGAPDEMSALMIARLLAQRTS